MASGKKGTKATPSESQAASTSLWALRSSRLYSFCTQAKPRRPAARAASWASASCAAEKFEQPISRTLPSATSWFIAASVSAIGT